MKTHIHRGLKGGAYPCWADAGQPIGRVLIRTRRVHEAVDSLVTAPTLRTPEPPALEHHLPCLDGVVPENPMGEWAIIIRVISINNNG